MLQDEFRAEGGVHGGEDAVGATLGYDLRTSSAVRRGAADAGFPRSSTHEDGETPTCVPPLGVQHCQGLPLGWLAGAGGDQAGGDLEGRRDVANMEFEQRDEDFGIAFQKRDRLRAHEG